VALDGTAATGSMRVKSSMRSAPGSPTVGNVFSTLRERRSAPSFTRDAISTRRSARSSGTMPPARIARTSFLFGAARMASVETPTSCESAFHPFAQASSEAGYPQVTRTSMSKALARGGTAAAGGHPLDGDGYFFAPTILTGVAEGTPIVDEEQFGLAVPVIPYRDLDDAVARANDTRYGLSGSVWSADPDRAAAVAARLECGTAFVNDHLTLQPYIPFGGMKWSGMGVENGPWGLEEFTALQVLYRSRS